MIALLGGALTDDCQIAATLAASLHTLRDHQAPNGCIPNNVDPDSGRANFRAYADGGLWWIIGSSIIEPDLATIRRIVAWYECQDVDRSGLISMQEGADWQDLFCTRGKGLYLNCVWVLALDRAAVVFENAGCPEEAARCRAHAEQTRCGINEYFWYAGDRNMLRHVRHTFSTESAGEQDSLGRKRWLPEKRYLVDQQFYLPYLGFRAAGEWFDTLGNLLAIIAGVADETRTNTILEFLECNKLTHFPARSIHPVVRRGDPDWRDYYGMLNVPYHYHNGGVWPFIGGFLVAALVAARRLDEAARALERLAALNLAGEFNEWHHGETGEPMGVREQAWSAGMYLFAHECVTRGDVPFF